MMNDAPPMPHHADAFLLAKEIEQRADALRSLGFNAVEIAGMVRETAWRPIESAPKDKELLLGWWSTWPELFWEVAAGLYGSTKGRWIHGQATHWMPLPAPPALTDEKGT